MNHDYDFIVIGRNAEDIGRQAHEMAARYFGELSYELDIDAEMARLDGKAYQARVRATLRPVESPPG